MKTAKRFQTGLLLVAILCVLSACSNSSLNRTAEQIARDLIESSMDFGYHGWQWDFDSIELTHFEVIKTLSKDNVVDYYIDINAKMSLRDGKTRNLAFHEDDVITIVVRYEKFKEGWAPTKVLALDAY